MTGYKTETQNQAELDLFLDFLIHKDIRLYCEIGLYAGDTFYEVYQTLKVIHGLERFCMIAVEFPTNMAAFANLQAVISTIRADPQVDLHFFVGNSTDPDIVEKVAEAVASTDFDTQQQRLVFIDSDHSWSHARMEYMAYSDMFTWTAFNDISERCIDANKAKHGVEIASVAHFYHALAIDKTEVLIEDASAPKARGIGILKKETSK